MPGALSARGRPRPVPAAVTIRDDLRDAIASLRLEPGAPILEKDLAQTYGVSRTPVREAMAKLVQEGLVSVFPQAGSFVSRIPFHALPEALVIRRSLEETAARLAAAEGSRDAVAGIAAALAEGRTAADAGDGDAFHAADERFHAAVAAAAGYPGLWRVVQQVKVQVDRFRRLTLPQPGRFARVLAEHEGVLRAVAAHDPEAAAAGMGAHIGGLLADLGAIAAAHPDRFDMAPRPDLGARPIPPAGHLP
ncbi:GntR family transcriptional regulator [Lichenibacterium ramalinae]|uniref:GntR family transcriptional regulator n=1 Tax=Lichenibacterium ramalinae TaxID=2316527 RepID=A0A4V1RI17_9HYPH|nr:GntR family transcriptional regulator [Lichenibacterium ramalinae]RYB01987.1 GntR family transcriptional regulator [Lichenibacterium ramalinae]